MYRRTWIAIAVLAAAAPAHADRHWRARVSLDDSMSHSGMSGSSKVKTTREAHASFELQLTTTDEEVNGTAWGWSTVTNVSGASGSMVEEMTVTTDDGHTTVIRFEGQPDASQLGLQCEYNKFTWRCGTGAIFKGKDTYISDGKVVKTVPQQKAEPVLIQKAGQGALVEKNGERFTFSSDFYGHKARIDIDPLDKTGYEAVFVMHDGYETFVPEGAPPDKPGKKGNAVELHIELRDAQTHKKSEKQFSATLTLDASHLPGTCMNYPAVGAPAPDEPDLYFEGGDEKTKVLPMGSGSGKVTIRSRDFGAFAKLTAHVKVADGAEVDVLTPDSGVPVIDIPKDDNANHIADIWEKAEHASGSLKSDADDEQLPSGLAPGDGYTLFEEYRGFVQADPKGNLEIGRGAKPKIIHGRLHPNDRDVMIGLQLASADDDRAVKKGLAIFAATTRAKLFYIADPKYLAAMDHDFSAQFPRRADSRGDGHPELFGKPQAAIWIESTYIPKGFGDPALAYSWHPYDQTKIKPDAPLTTTNLLGSPRDVMFVIVARKNAEESVSGMTCYLDPDCNVTNDRKKEWDAGVKGLLSEDQRRIKAKQAKNIATRLTDELVTFTVTHELGHTLGAYHHGNTSGGDDGGNKACPMRYWQTGDDWPAMIDFLDGTWDLSTPHKGDGSTWEWCSENLPTMHLADP
jgi:hypothetical protein